jgi:two-component system, OmpR family, KDP operon response regulator KdpE
MDAGEPMIVIIEDDVRMGAFLKTLVGGHGYQLALATSGESGILEVASRDADVVLLDLGLPDMDGLEVIRRLREWYEGPILILSARGMEQDKVDALDLGADDYLTKPFGAGELLARLRVLLRRAAALRAEEAPGAVFTLGALCVDMAARRVTRDGEELALTPTEYKLLITLIKYAGRVVTHKQLLREVWGQRLGSQAHHVRVHMSHLRHKIEPDPAQPRYIRTETGVGYRLLES